MSAPHSRRGFFSRVAAFFAGTAAVKSGVADKPNIIAEMDAALKRIPPLSEGQPVVYRSESNVIWAEHTDFGQVMICSPMGGLTQVYRDHYRWMTRNDNAILEAYVDTDVAMANLSGEPFAAMPLFGPTAYRRREAAMIVGWDVIDAVSKTSDSTGLDPILYDLKWKPHSGPYTYEPKTRLPELP